jgi:hypothetical protein
VITVSEHQAAPPQSSVDGFGDADAQALRPASERAPIASFGQQVQMVALYREVHQTKAKPIPPRAKRRADGTEHRAAAQRLDTGADTQRHVDGMVGRESGTSQMGDAGTGAVRGAPAPGLAPPHARNWNESCRALRDLIRGTAVGFPPSG